MTKKAILVITDGIGHNPSDKNNAFANAKKPTYDYLFANVPNSKIATSGLKVGLPDGQMGNSEVGHMTIGSGRVMYQDLVKIDKAIEENTLTKTKTIKHIDENAKHIHLVGLCSDGGVHSHINHILYLAKKLSTSHKIYLHLITDGRDVAPDSAKKYIQQADDICNENIKIATIGGRYYAMDRDNNFDRVKKSFDVIYDGANKIENWREYIDKSYEQKIFDEFLEPVSVGDYDGIKDGDGVVMCNFRSDRAREITQALCDKEFKEFKKQNKDIISVTMTKYKDDFDFLVVFDKDVPKNTLSEVISNNNLTQVHTAETEKYAHVTFFLNGTVEKCYPKEEHILVPSPKVATYDLKPEMSAYEVCDKVLESMQKDTDFIVVNFANGDMVGHTGDYEASIKAVEAVDVQLGKICQKAKEMDYNVFITSDHGNCEMMRDENGNTLTNHTTTDVYGFCISKEVKSLKDGGLDNIAPTILKLMGLEIPQEMNQALY